MTVGDARIDWRPRGDFERLVLTVSGPGGVLTERAFAGGETAALEALDADGQRRRTVSTPTGSKGRPR